MYDAFISHSSKNKEAVVLEFVERLEEKGISVWLDQKEILYGENILEKVADGIQGSYAVLLVLTPEFFESFWTPLEIGVSLGHPLMTNVIPIIVNASKDIIKTKFPWILTVKHIEYDYSNVDKTINETQKAITDLKLKSRHKAPELIYRNSVRKLHSIDMPAPNKISILVTEYDQISKINVNTAIYQASQIAKAIIDDLSEKNCLSFLKTSPLQKLEGLLNEATGLSKNTYEHLKLLLNIDDGNTLPAFTNDASRKKMVDMSIASVVDWYASYLKSNVLPNDECLDIVQAGTLTQQDFLDIYEIDRLVLRHDLIAPASVAYSWYKYNVYSHIAIRSRVTEKIIGYITLFPITDELFQEIKQGNFKDSHLSTDRIRQYDMPDFYILYVSCVAIHPAYQNTKAFSFLYKAVIQMMLDLAVEREVYVTEIITEASTTQGEKLCKIIGLKKMCDTNLGTALYQGTLLPPSLRLASLAGSRLIHFYQDKYEQFKLLF